MANRDLHNNIVIEQILDPVVGSTDVNTTAIDMQGYDSLEIIVNFGESGDTLSGSVKIDCLLKEGTTSTVADHAVVANTAHVLDRGNALAYSASTGIFATVDAAAEDDAVYKVGYVGDKRYVSVTLDFTGTHTNGIPVSVSAIKKRASQLPTT
jgi:hypothetical protein